MNKIIKSNNIHSFKRWIAPGVEKLCNIEQINLEHPELQVKLEKMLLQAREEGFSLGKEQALQQTKQMVEQQCQQQQGQLAEVLKALQNSSAEINKQVELCLVKLSMAIAVQLFKHELKAQPQQIQNIVKEALNLLPEQTKNIHLHLHPDNLQFLQNVDLKLPLTQAEIEFVEDANLQAGDFMVYTDIAKIDASLATRIKNIVEDLLRE